MQSYQRCIFGKSPSVVSSVVRRVHRTSLRVERRLLMRSCPPQHLASRMNRQLVDSYCGHSARPSSAPLLILDRVIRWHLKQCWVRLRLLQLCHSSLGVPVPGIGSFLQERDTDILRTPRLPYSRKSAVVAVCARWSRPCSFGSGRQETFLTAGTPASL